mmetsp:Transcript_2573/g.10211  ORF Transcript_2573/g.10211 Transcript_2573/m.10211 type:complete len:443 (+) Transcript_2573:595-1923(+)
MEPGAPPEEVRRGHLRDGVQGGLPRHRRRREAGERRHHRLPGLRRAISPGVRDSVAAPPPQHRRRGRRHHGGAAPQVRHRHGLLPQRGPDELHHGAARGAQEPGRHVRHPHDDPFLPGHRPRLPLPSHACPRHPARPEARQRAGQPLLQRASGGLWALPNGPRGPRDGPPAHAVRLPCMDRPRDRSEQAVHEQGRRLLVRHHDVAAAHARRAVHWPGEQPRPRLRRGGARPQAQGPRLLPAGLRPLDDPVLGHRPRRSPRLWRDPAATHRTPQGARRGPPSHFPRAGPSGPQGGPPVRRRPRAAGGLPVRAQLVKASLGASEQPSRSARGRGSGGRSGGGTPGAHCPIGRVRGRARGCGCAWLHVQAPRVCPPSCRAGRPQGRSRAAGRSRRRHCSGRAWPRVSERAPLKCAFSECECRFLSCRASLWLPLVKQRVCAAVLW